MGTVVLVIGSLAVAGAAALLASCLRLRSAIGFLVASYLLASAEIVAIALLLSTGAWLTRGMLLAGFAVSLAAAIAVWSWRGRPLPPLSRRSARMLRDALRDPVVFTLAALAAAVHAYLLVVTLSVPQSLPDTMLYHLPRAALWKQQHAVGYVSNAPDERIDAFPPSAEIQVLASMILSRGDRYVGLPQLFSVLAACGAIIGIARRLGFGPSASAFGAAAFATFTVVLLQTPTALNDLVVASLLVGAAYFGMGATRAELALSALALALAIGTKGTAVFALPALALFVLASQPRDRWARVAAFGAASLVAGSFWFAVNLAQTGELDGGIVLDRGTEPLAERVRLSVVDLLELSNGDGTGLLLRPIWSALALALAAVAAAALAARKRFRASGVAMLVGAIAFAVTPMLVIWSHVASRAFQQARVALGQSGESVSRLPATYDESAMHSSFGLAFVVLLFGAGALVALDVAGRRLRVAALVALFGVPLTLLMTALMLAYDPQRMRYVVFSAALAASVFGIVLRVRPLAWASVALTAGTLAVSVAYFVPRPASLALLPANREDVRSARWFVQAGGGAGDPDAFRFLAEQVPADATVALAVLDNTYLYPAWDAGLRRTVLFVPPDGAVPDDADWLVAGPGKEIDEGRLERAGWRLALESGGGWRIYER